MNIAELKNMRLALIACILMLTSFTLEAQIPYEQNRGHISATLVNDLDALAARIDVIRNAKIDLLFSTYSSTDHPWSHDTLYSIYGWLAKQARAGVKVKILIDEFASFEKLPKDLRDYLLSIENLEVYSFASSIDVIGNHRMHDKLVISDGREMILGSRNADSFYASSSVVTHERDLYVRGPQVQFAQKYFYELLTNETWIKKRTGGSTMPVSEPEVVRLAQMRVEKMLTESARPSWRTNLVPAQFVKFLYSSVGNKIEENNQSLFAINYILNQAQQGDVIYMESFFVVLPGPIAQAIKAAVGRGARVVVFTNSKASLNEKWMGEVYQAYRYELIQLGVELYERNGELGPLHSKSVVGVYKEGFYRSYVGSFNLDSRSTRLNTEVGVYLESLDFGRVQTNEILQQKSYSKLVSMTEQEIEAAKKQTTLLDKLMREFF